MFFSSVAKCLCFGNNLIRIRRRYRIRNQLYSPSIERTNDCLPYIKSNICFVMRPFICTDKSNFRFHEGVTWDLNDGVLHDHVAQGCHKEDVEERQLRKKEILQRYILVVTRTDIIIILIITFYSTVCTYCELRHFRCVL
jgi:hypothetical protein